MAHEEEIPYGTIIPDFDIHIPVNDETCRAQISANISRNLPEAVPKGLRRKLSIIANGPSARDANLVNLSGKTLALNGGIKLFLDQGLSPNYWACCDPQPLVADFLPDNPPADTTYLVASKCHSSIFDKLKGNDVRLWHLMDHPANGLERIALASSVTLSAVWLMHRLGFTDFEFWGWDGCFLDGRHHAIGDADWSTKPVLHINYGGSEKDGEIVGGKNFATTRTWAAEAQGAEQFFALANYLGIGVKINGDGMFECLHRTVSKAA